MADDITIQIQENPSVTISVNTDVDLLLSASESCPLTDWGTIQGKPDFDSLYYSTSNPSGYVSSGSFVTQATLNQTGQYLLSVNTSTSGALRSSISILESKTGSYYSSTNPSGFITGAVVRPNTYLLIDSNSLDSINWQTRQLSFEGLQSISWADRIAYDISEDPSIDWANRELFGDWESQADPTGSYSLVNLAFLQSYAYPASNPSGFATGIDSSNFVLKSQTGQFYASSNPSGYITGVNTGSLSSVFYPLTSNPSGYVTGSVVRPSDTGAFYPRSNPSGFITGVDTSLLVLKSETGAYTGLFYPLASNPSGYLISSALSSYATQSYVNSVSGVIRTDISAIQSLTGGFVTGSVVRPTETGAFVTSGQTGQFYSSSNPSGYITGVNTGSLSSAFYPLNSNPSNYVTGLVVRPIETGGFLTSGSLSSYATTGYVNAVSGAIRSDISLLQTATGLLYPRTNPSGYITGVDTSSFVTTGQTGDYANTFYPKASNPSGYVTGSVVRPTETGAFLTSFQITGAGTVSSYTSGAFVVMSGAAGGGGITQGEADARYYPLATNPSGYVTGSVVRPADTGLFVTTSQTGAFYAANNPSGYITGFNSGSYVLTSQTGTFTGAFYPLTSNPSGYVTGSVVRPTDTGSFITTSQTGAFYASSNPSGYITSSALSSYATQAYVNSASGVIRVDISALQSATGNYYLASNPSGFVTGSVVRPTETGSFVTTGFGATGYYPRSTNPSGYVTGSVIRASDTGDFYPRSNPSGYTGVNDYRQLGPKAVPYPDFGQNLEKLLWTKTTGDKPVFSTFDHASPSYIKNSSGIGADIDFTCCSVWNSDGGQEKAGTAITPRHVAYAYHYSIATGSTLRFVTNDNQVVTRTLTGAIRVGSTDLIIGGLDSDLPSSIRPSKVLPSGYERIIFPGSASSSYMNSAGMFLNKNRNISAAAISRYLTATGSVAEPYYGISDSFYEAPVLGDSGCPVFLLAGNQPVFLGPLYTPTTFTWASSNITGVNNVLTQLGGGHQLSFIDLGHYSPTKVGGTSLNIFSDIYAPSFISTNSPGFALTVTNDGSDGMNLTTVSGTALDVSSSSGEAFLATTANPDSAIASFAYFFSRRLQVLSNGSLYFYQTDNTVSPSGKLLSAGVETLDWTNLSLSNQWSHPSIATSSGHVANYHAVTGYSYPRATNPSGYVTGSVVRPTDTGAFLTTAKVTGAGTVSSYLSGSVVVLSGAAGGGGLTQGQADALYYPLTGNPSGFATGSVVRPSETGSFLTSSQTGTLTGAFYPLGANPSGYVTGSVTRPTETGAFLITGAVTGAGSVTVSTSGNSLVISGSASAATQAPRILGCVFDGGGSVLETGSKGYIRVSQSGTLYKYTALADITGSAIIDIYKNTYANYPPTSSSSITSGSKPTISTGIKTESSTLTGFSSVTFSSGDVFGINLDSCSGITRLTFELEYQP